MIKPENIIIDNIEFLKQYSDQGYMIQKVGTNELYSEAIDPLDTNRTYEETDIPISNSVELTDEEFRKLIEEAL